MNLNMVNIMKLVGIQADLRDFQLPTAYIHDFTPNFFFYLTVWFYYILVAVALVKGYTYRSSVLKISAFIALILPEPDFVSFLLSLFRIYGSWIMWLVSYILRIIFAVIFLVSAIQLLKKNAGSRK